MAKFEARIDYPVWWRFVRGDTSADCLKQVNEIHDRNMPKFKGAELFKEGVETPIAVWKDGNWFFRMPISPKECDMKEMIEE